MSTSKKKKRYFKTAFKWGRHEHFLEAVSNWMLLIIVIVSWLKFLLEYYSIFNYSHTYSLIILPLVTMCFIVHSLARFCHRREKKFHTLARK